MHDQLKLWDGMQDPSAKGSVSERPIHYLGSKLRLLRQISDALDTVDPQRGPTCDLFAGSGTVAGMLAAHRPVVAVDIQEYSRVLCSALLNPTACAESQVRSFVKRCRTGELAARLREALQPLIDYERASIKCGMQGDLEPLCELLENGSLYAFDVQGAEASLSPEIRQCLLEARGRLQEDNMWESPVSMMARYYGGVYFSYEQALSFDCILQQISEGLKEKDRDTFLAAALSTASEVVNTVGKQFAQPIRPRRSDGTPKPRLAQSVVKDRRKNVFRIYRHWLHKYLTRGSTDQDHRAIKCDYRQFFEKYSGPLSAVYADPPYTRDHYSRFYHVLESMCLRDNPGVSTTKIGGEERLSRGLYRDDRHQSPFCIKSQVRDAFRALFAGAARFDAPLVLSYSPDYREEGGRPRLMSVEGLVELAQEEYAYVEVAPVEDITHSKLNRSNLNSEVRAEAEVLLKCSV